MSSPVNVFCKMNFRKSVALKIGEQPLFSSNVDIMRVIEFLAMLCVGKKYSEKH